MWSVPRLRRLVSVASRIHAAEYISATGSPGSAGHLWFPGGIFVDTCTVSDRDLTTLPTSCSLWPEP